MRKCHTLSITFERKGEQTEAGPSHGEVTDAAEPPPRGRTLCSVSPEKSDCTGALGHAYTDSSRGKHVEKVSKYYLKVSGSVYDASYVWETKGNVTKIEAVTPAHSLITQNHNRSWEHVGGIFYTSGFFPVDTNQGLSHILSHMLLTCAF